MPTVPAASPLTAPVFVSVILPVYNGAKTLAATIESLLAQDYPHFEVIVVNDGSPDDSESVINRYLHDRRLVYIKSVNRGVGAARNLGISHARGNVIGLCDQDDQWYSTKLSRQVPLFNDADVGLVYSGVDVLNTEDGARQYRPVTFRGHCFEKIFQANFVIACSVLARRDIIDAVGGFDEDRALMGVDDRHLWSKIALFRKFDAVDEALAAYFRHPNNYSKQEEKMLNADLLYIRKIATLYPERVNSELVKETLIYTYVTYANNFRYIGDYGKAASNYTKAWQLRPLNLLPLLMAAICGLVPGTVINAARTTLRRWRGRQ